LDDRSNGLYVGGAGKYLRVRVFAVAPSHQNI
jgi:hypothetical protein